MEAFSLLKYWRGNGGGAGGGCVTLDSGANVRTTTSNGTTIVTDVSQNTVESDEDDDDDGPFFDLEFAMPDEDEEVKNEEDCSNSAENGDEAGEDDDDESEATEEENEEEEFKFTLSSGSSGDQTDPNVSLSSPSDDLFFKGRLVPIEAVEPPSVVFNGSDSSSEQNSKSQFPVSLLKSATKFRVLMLKFKKSKTNVTENNTEPNQNASESAIPKPQQQKQNQSQSKFFTVKLKVEEVPIVSLFTRDNSSRSKLHHNQKQNSNSEESASDSEKRFSKDVMQRYLKMVKPLYVRVSKRYGEKLKFSGQLSLGSLGVTKAEPLTPSPAAEKLPTAESKPSETEAEKPEVTDAPPPSGNVKREKQVNLPAGLRVVCKHLGKSRSASSAVAAAPTAPAGTVSSKRRDDSLLQQQDGIQSAILHCKRSFNASRDSESLILSRSVSDPLHEKSFKVSTTKSSSGEAKERCI